MQQDLKQASPGDAAVSNHISHQQAAESETKNRVKSAIWIWICSVWLHLHMDCSGAHGDLRLKVSFQGPTSMSPGGHNSKASLVILNNRGSRKVPQNATPMRHDTLWTGNHIGLSPTCCQVSVTPTFWITQAK